MPLNEGPIRLTGNRITRSLWRSTPRVAVSLSSQRSFTVVVEDNHDGLEGEPPPFQGPERSRETLPR